MSEFDLSNRICAAYKTLVTRLRGYTDKLRNLLTNCDGSMTEGTTFQSGPTQYSDLHFNPQGK